MRERLSYFPELFFLKREQSGGGGIGNWASVRERSIYIYRAEAVHLLIKRNKRGITLGVDYRNATLVVEYNDWRVTKRLTINLKFIEGCAYTL